jgi:hypothetical protein
LLKKKKKSILHLFIAAFFKILEFAFHLLAAIRVKKRARKSEFSEDKKKHIKTQHSIRKPKLQQSEWKEGSQKFY